MLARYVFVLHPPVVPNSQNVSWFIIAERRGRSSQWRDTNWRLWCSGLARKASQSVSIFEVHSWVDWGASRWFGWVSLCSMASWGDSSTWILLQMWRCCKLVVAENLFPVVLMSDILNNPTWAWIFEFFNFKIWSLILFIGFWKTEPDSWCHILVKELWVVHLPSSHIVWVRVYG